MPEPECYPADDLTGYSEGQELLLTLRILSSSSEPFIVRGYQRGAAAG